MPAAHTMNFKWDLEHSALHQDMIICRLHAWMMKVHIMHNEKISSKLIPLGVHFKINECAFTNRYQLISVLQNIITNCTILKAQNFYVSKKSQLWPSHEDVEWRHCSHTGLDLSQIYFLSLCDINFIITGCMRGLCVDVRVPCLLYAATTSYGIRLCICGMCPPNGLQKVSINRTTMHPQLSVYTSVWVYIQALSLTAAMSIGYGHLGSSQLLNINKIFKYVLVCVCLQSNFEILTRC